MTLDEMKGRGWEFTNYINCRECGDECELWKSPQGNWAVFQPMNKGSDETVIHRNVCSDAKEKPVAGKSTSVSVGRRPKKKRG